MTADRPARFLMAPVDRIGAVWEAARDVLITPIHLPVPVPAGQVWRIRRVSDR